jgi:hypothetical protein
MIVTGTAKIAPCIKHGLPKSSMMAVKWKYFPRKIGFFTSAPEIYFKKQLVKACLYLDIQTMYIR